MEFLPPLASRLGRAPRRAFFAEPGWHVWCGTVAKGPDGAFYLLYSRWPVEKGFDAWVTASEIAVARSDNAEGPFLPIGVALAGAGGDAWDADVTHNPTVTQANGRYVLYYMGNRGDGSFWDHRNRQRIGVAWAEHPAGPWQRRPQPLIDVNPGSWDALMTSNPTVTKTGDGRWLMIYKTVSEGPRPFGGPVLHAVAFADDPLGLFTRQQHPVFTHAGESFPAEDPFVWREGEGYRAIVKDMRGVFTGVAPSLAEFQSSNGTDWSLRDPALVAGCEIPWADGTLEPVERLERPQLVFVEGNPVMLRAAVLRHDGSTGNMAIPIHPASESRGCPASSALGQTHRTLFPQS